MLRSTFFGDCPNCVFGHLFDGPLHLHARDRCEECGMHFDPGGGDGSTWLGAAFLVYFVAMALLFAEALVLALNFGLFPGFTWLLLGSAVPIVALCYRPLRGWWVWCQWTLGFLGD